MYKIETANEIKSYDGTGILIRADILSYGEDYVAADLEERDIPSVSVVNDLIEEAISGGAPSLADGVITPGGITIDGAYLATFDPQFVYRLNTVVYEPTQVDLQLDPKDATYTRIDLIVGTDTGTYEKVTGVAAATYEQPTPPPGTLVLAQVYRMPDGTNVIIINDTDGYILKVGDTMFGRFTIANGNDLVLRAPSGSLGPNEIGRDSGDIVFQWGTGYETRRLYINHATGDLTIKEDSDFEKAHIVQNTGNACEVIEDYEPIDGVASVDLTEICETISYGLTLRNALFPFPYIRAYSKEDLGGGTIKYTLIPGTSPVITELNGVPQSVSIEGVFDSEVRLILSNQ